MDCAGINKSKEIFNFIKEQNKQKTKIEILYTPPYSPHLNLSIRFKCGEYTGKYQSSISISTLFIKSINLRL